jgi:hypothetical protein
MFYLSASPYTIDEYAIGGGSGSIKNLIIQRAFKKEKIGLTGS